MIETPPLNAKALQAQLKEFLLAPSLVENENKRGYWLKCSHFYPTLIQYIVVHPDPRPVTLVDLSLYILRYLFAYFTEYNCVLVSHVVQQKTQDNLQETQNK